MTKKKIILDSAQTVANPYATTILDIELLQILKWKKKISATLATCSSHQYHGLAFLVVVVVVVKLLTDLDSKFLNICCTLFGPKVCGWSRMIILR